MSTEPLLTQHKVTVLLIDDQPMIGEAVRRMLAGEPDIVFNYCRDATKALDEAARIKPTVILQDLVMPDIDGLTLVKNFRANEATKETPMIVLSTKEEPAVKAEAFALGANDYIVKLPDRLELLARIRYHSKGYIEPASAERGLPGPAGEPEAAGQRGEAGGQVRPVAPAREAQEGRRSRPTGGSFPRPSWGATRSATTGSTTTISPSTCWTSAATASARRCSRSRP